MTTGSFWKKKWKKALQDLCTIDHRRGFLISKNGIFLRNLILRGDFEVRFYKINAQKMMFFLKKTHLFLQINLQMGNLCKTSKFSQKVDFKGGFRTAFLWENAQKIMSLAKTCILMWKNMSECGIYAKFWYKIKTCQNAEFMQVIWLYTLKNAWFWLKK